MYVCMFKCDYNKKSKSTKSVKFQVHVPVLTFISCKKWTSLNFLVS